MDPKDTITKTVKWSETIEGREQNQFAYHVKAKKECSYGMKEGEREPSFKDEKGLSQQKESGYETKLTKTKEKIRSVVL